MHSKNKKDCLKTVLFYSHLQNVPHMWYLLIPRCSFLYHICGTFLSTTKCITYVVSFWYHKRARNPLLMFRSQKTWYHRMEGNGRRLSRASRCMWINPLDVHSPKFTHNFFGDDVFSGVSFNLRRSNLQYGDFSGPPQRWPYLLFKGSIFTTPKEPPQRFFLNRHISRYLNFNSKAYFEISIPQHGKKKSIKKPMSKFINYFFCLKKISLILGV